MAQHVAVMYAGRIVEYADAETLFLKPKHPYTVGLMESIPAAGRKKKKRRLTTISGVVPSLFTLPEGCHFSDRCPEVFSDCRKSLPRRYHVGNHHIVRCFKYA
jgi:oligopeptide/dipeptide ABC transporter ATP-binding protein